jgi:hypothetical protein
MNKQKEFDCVEMKRQAQEKVRQKYAGIPDEEARRRQREAALADPIIGPFLTRLRSHSARPGKPAMR